MIDEDTRRSPGDLLALLAREHVTGLCQNSLFLLSRGRIRSYVAIA